MWNLQSYPILNERMWHFKEGSNILNILWPPPTYFFSGGQDPRNPMIYAPAIKDILQWSVRVRTAGNLLFVLSRPATWQWRIGIFLLRSPPAAFPGSVGLTSACVWTTSSNELDPRTTRDGIGPGRVPPRSRNTANTAGGRTDKNGATGCRPGSAAARPSPLIPIKVGRGGNEIRRGIVPASDSLTG